MKSAWEEELINEFVDNTLAGKGRNLHLDSDPAIPKKDPAPAPTKEEL